MSRQRIELNEALELARKAAGRNQSRAALAASIALEEQAAAVCWHVDRALEALHRPPLTVVPDAA